MTKKDGNARSPSAKNQGIPEQVILIRAHDPATGLSPVRFPGSPMAISVNHHPMFDGMGPSLSHIAIGHLMRPLDEDTPAEVKSALFRIGALVRVSGTVRSGKAFTFYAEPGMRARLFDLELRGDIFFTRWEAVPEIMPSADELSGRIQKLRQVISDLPVTMMEEGGLPPYLDVNLVNSENVIQFVDSWAHIFNSFIRDVKIADYLRSILAEANVSSRIDRLIELMEYTAENMGVVAKSLQPQRIVKSADSYDEQYEKIKDRLPEDMRREIEHELQFIKQMPKTVQERAHLERWLSFVLSLPWGEYKEEQRTLLEVAKILQEAHWGLTRIEDRIIRYLAAHRRNPKKRGPKLGFFGPPGVGKTSLGQAIAKSLGRPFVRISLGGVRDEAIIRGHGKTYIGAIAGEIAKGLRNAGAMNPVFMIDEIDKIERGGPQGNPEAALLELLDPEQNYSFRDDYLGGPLDVSRVLFILTGNVFERVAAPLRDRIEAIHFPGYTERDKLEIAKRHIVPRLLKENNLTVERLREEGIPEIEIVEGTILRLIETTDEAGMRKLEERLGEVCENIARKIDEGSGPTSADTFWEITPDNLHQFISREVLRGKEDDSDLFELDPGIAIGLAVTDHGGDLMIVEATYRRNPKLELHITGHLDQIEPEAQTIKDSTKVALDRLTHHGGILEGADLRKRIGINFANGSVPKVGPSAGVTLYVALYSMFTNQSVKTGLAMTGELRKKRKNIKGVGGIRDKVLVAIRKKMKDVIIPHSNREDIEDLHPDDRARITIHFVRTPEEALRVAFPDDTRIAEYITREQRSS